MPHEVETDNPELDRIDAIDDAFKRFGIRSDEIVPNEIRLRGDNYNNEDSDSNSDDGRSLRAESREGSEEEDPEVFKKTTLQKAMSTGSDTSAVSIESETLEKGNHVPSFRYSSDGSSPSTSDVESDSDDSTDDEEDCSDSEDLIKKLEELEVSGGDNDAETKSQRDVNANNKVDEKHFTKNKTLKNDNDDHNTNRRPDNVPTIFKNEKINNTDQDDSEDDDSVRTRGPHRGKPYDRKSPTPSLKYNLTTEEVEAIVAEYWPEASRQLEPLLARMVAESPDLDPTTKSPNIPDVTVSSPTLQQPTSTYNFVPDLMTMSPITQSSANLLRQTVLSPMSSGSSTVSDENRQSPESYVSEIDASSQGGICEGFQECFRWNNEIPSTSTSPAVSEQNDSNSLDLFAENSHQLQDPLPIDDFIAKSLNHIYDNNDNREPPTPGMEMFNTTFQDKTQNPFPDVMPAWQTNDYTFLPNAMLNIPELQENLSISQSNIQSGLDQQSVTFPSQLSSSQKNSIAFSVPTTTTPAQNGISFSPPAFQFHTVTTAMQDGTGSVTITNSDFTTRGTVTITHGNNPVQINECMRNIVQQSGDQGLPQNSISNGTDHRPIPSVPTTTCRTSTSPIAIPTTVQNIQNQSSPPSRNLRQIASWALLSPPSVSALERLKKNVSGKKHLQAMNFLYGYPAVAFTERNEMGDTYLMTMVRDPTRLKNRLHRLAPVLAKMETIPGSLIARSHYDNYDALYLAAINCPDFDFVTGVLAAYIMKTCLGRHEVWRRTYDNGDTLIHAVAARGDKYEAILRELLAVKTTENCSPFDLSAKNREGKTPCHVAVESHDLKNGISTTNIVRILMEYGADPTIKDNKSGDTPLHMAMSRKCSTGLVQALLCNTGSRATNVVNYAGNMPIHLAAAALNDVDAYIQIEVCYRLIAAGARTNIPNLRHKMPLALVAAERRPIIKGIFYKKS